MTKGVTILSIKMQVYEIIKEKILNQEFSFGEKINLNALCSEIGVSNTPIREALSLLEKEGLIENVPNVGPKIVSFNRDGYREITEVVVLLLEGGYFLCKKNNALSDLIALMKECIEKQKKLLYNKKKINITEYARAAIAFDACFLRESKNQKLIAIFNGLYGLFLLMVLFDYQNREIDKKKNLQEHEAILSAVEEDDSNLVITLLREHYDKSFLFQ